MRIRTWLATGWLATRWLAAGGLAATAALAADPFGGAVRLRDDGAARTIAFAGAPVRLRPVRFEPKPGTSEWPAQVRCGVTIEGPLHPPAHLVTIGVDETEALSCDGLAEAAALPARHRGPVLALVYRTRSPNEAGRTAVLIRRGEHGWRIDQPLSDEMQTRLGQPTLATLRHALLR